MVVWNKSSLLWTAHVFFEWNVFCSLFAENHIHQLFLHGNVWIWGQEYELESFSDFSKVSVAKEVGKQGDLRVNLLVSGHLIDDDAFFNDVRR
jgi:hypothetical protein